MTSNPSDTTAPRLDCDVACVLDVRNGTGESPAWSAREAALYWVDITGARVHRWRPADGAHTQWALPAVVGSLGLRAAGGLVLALRTGLHLFDTASGQLTLLCHPEADRPGNRYNDGRVSPDGRFWVGSMDDRPQKEATARLYRLDADHRCSEIDAGLVVSNGLAFSPDGATLYHSDSRRATIWRRAHDPATGAVGAREVFAHVPAEHGRPDGAAVDAEGCYWSCGVSAGRLNRYSPQGRLIAWVPMPVSHPTMPCFGGADLATLYVTSLRDGLSPADLQRSPQAGGLFALRPGVAGLPTPLYAG
jgi:sugar lactone lactonase YvrE